MFVVTFRSSYLPQVTSHCLDSTAYFETRRSFGRLGKENKQSQQQVRGQIFQLGKKHGVSSGSCVLWLYGGKGHSHNAKILTHQVGGEPEDVGDSLALRGLVPTASLDENSDLGRWRIVLQGGDHQATGQPSHLDRKAQEEILQK